MKNILEKYLNKEVGINIEKVFRFDAAQVIAVEETYFSIKDAKQAYVHHFSYHSIVQIIENDNGIDIGGFLSHKHFSVVIKVGHIFEYVPA